MTGNIVVEPNGHERLWLPASRRPVTCRPVRTGTVAGFEKLVSAHQIHYYAADGGFGGRGFGGGGPGGGTTDASQISTWVAAHFTAKTMGGMTVCDLTTPARS